MENNKGFMNSIRRILFGSTGRSGQMKKARDRNESSDEEAKPVHDQQLFDPAEIKKRNEDFVRLAGQCAMGDTESMMELAEWFRSGFEPGLEAVISAYEENPDEINCEKLKKYINNLSNGSLSIDAYTFWIGRAALYGNEKAGEMIKRYAYYDTRSYSFMPRKLFSPGNRGFTDYWFSDTLFQFGLVEIPRGETDCRLCTIKENGCFNFYYVSWYCPADEDGFGREMEYTDIYYDEFFKRIPARDEEEIQSGLLKIKEERERYWQVSENNAQMRKYKKSICPEA